MNASFEEKSVWIQLVSILLVLGGYFIVAGRMLAEGVVSLPAFVPVFVVAVLLLAAVLVAGHVIAAIVSRPEGRDERDRQIEWRAESHASWILAAGVLLAIAGLVAALESAWIAHGLLLSLFAAEIVKYVLQLVFYRRGI